MFRNTNPVGNGRSRPQRISDGGEKHDGEKKYFISYKFNNPRHIARNYKALESQNGNNQRRNAPVCLLCINFGHMERF